MVKLRDPVVVQPHEVDHVANVGVRADRPRARPLGAGEDRVRLDPTLGPQLLPDALREHEVGGAVAVQVADLAAAEPEAPLAPPAVAGGDAAPGGDLVGDALAWCRRGAHAIQGIPAVPLAVSRGTRAGTRSARPAPPRAGSAPMRAGRRARRPPTAAR